SATASINAFLEGRLDVSGPLRLEFLDQPLGFASFPDHLIERIEKDGLVKPARVAAVALEKAPTGNIQDFCSDLAQRPPLDHRPKAEMRNAGVQFFSRLGAP